MTEQERPAPRDALSEWLEAYQRDHPEARSWANETREAEEARRRAAESAGVMSPPIARYSTIDHPTA